MSDTKLSVIDGGNVEDCQLITSLDCFRHVHKMIIEGVLPRKVAVTIRNKYKEALDVPIEMLTAVVRDYRSRIQAPEYAKTDLTTQMQSDGDLAIDTLRFLVKNQRERIEMESLTEKKLGKLFSTMPKEVKAAIDASKELLKATSARGESGHSSNSEVSMEGKLPLLRIMNDQEKVRKVMRGIETIVGDPDLLAEIGRVTKKEKKKKDIPTSSSDDSSNGVGVKPEPGCGDKIPTQCDRTPYERAPAKQPSKNTKSVSPRKRKKSPKAKGSR